MGTLNLTARLVTDFTLPKGTDLPIQFRANSDCLPGPIPKEGKVVFLFPGQGFRGLGHGLMGKLLVEGMLERGYSTPLGAIGSSSGGPAAAIAGMAALGKDGQVSRADIEAMWLGAHRLLSRPGRLLRSLLGRGVPLPQHEVRDALIAGIDFEAVMKSPTTVGLVGAQNVFKDQAGPFLGALGGLAVTLGQYLVNPESEDLPRVAAVQYKSAMRALRFAWKPVGWVNHLPSGVEKPEQVRVVRDADEMHGAMLATMNLPGLFGLGHSMVADLGPHGTTTQFLDGAIAMGAAVTEAVLLGATDIIVVTDSAYANIHWNDVSAAILKGACQVSKAAEVISHPRRLHRVISGTTKALREKTQPRDVVATMSNTSLNPAERGIRLYAIPLLPDHFPDDVIRFGEFRPTRVGQIMDLSEAMADATLEVLFPLIS